MPITYNPPQGSTPSYTTSQRLALHPTGAMIVFDSTLDEYFIWDVNAMMWIVLGTSGGTPDVTTAQRLALTPTSGLIVYDTDIGGYFKWDVNTSSWQPF